MEKKNKMEKVESKNLAAANDEKDCPIHGNLKTRGKTFEGVVIRKFKKRVAIEFERMIFVRKFERFMKGKTKIHARLPVCIEDQIKIGDMIKIKECRPLSKLIHFVVLGKVNNEKIGNLKESK